MRMSNDVFHLMAALKELHQEVIALRKDIDELRDEVKVMDRSGGLQFVLGSEEDAESESEASSESAQSAPF